MGAFIVAIDGYAGCGKTTLARYLAEQLRFTHIDTGAMYRAITLYFLDKHIDVDDEVVATPHLDCLTIRYVYQNNCQQIFLNEKEVSEAIRTKRVNEAVSLYAKKAYIREFAMNLQRTYANETGRIVMEGRDIGTVIFPMAQVKLFLRCDVRVRAKRRLAEMQEQVDLTEVMHNLKERDDIDEHREHSPLRQAEDAIVIDTTDLTLEGLFTKALVIVAQRSQN